MTTKPKQKRKSKRKPKLRLNIQVRPSKQDLKDKWSDVNRPGE